MKAGCQGPPPPTTQIICWLSAWWMNHRLLRDTQVSVKAHQFGPGAQRTGSSCSAASHLFVIQRDSKIFTCFTCHPLLNGWISPHLAIRIISSFHWTSLAPFTEYLLFSSTEFLNGFSWFSSYCMYSLSVTDHQSRKAPLLFAAIPTLPKCSLRDFHFALVPLRTPIELKLQGARPRHLSRDSCTSQAGPTSLCSVPAPTKH